LRVVSEMSSRQMLAVAWPAGELMPRISIVPRPAPACVLKETSARCDG
jgi:hypothetical protein